MSDFDANIIGAGPNGLAAAIELALAGKSVCIYEANETVGGGARSGELTLPGFVHDICSAVHPLAAGSPFFSTLPLDHYGLEFIHPPASLAHPFDDGTAVVLERSVQTTSETLGRDRQTYYSLMTPLMESWNGLAEDLLGPPRLPRHPFAAARFGIHGLWPARAFA